MSPENKPNAESIQINFLDAQSDYVRRHSSLRNQMIARAAGLKQGRRPFVLDATAGLGGDAYVLAHLGCQVLCLERSKVVCGALHAAILNAQAAEDPGALRMRVIQANAITMLQNWPTDEPKPDVVYLDPMFPDKQKSALPKLAMRQLKDLVGEDADAADLLAPARALAKRVVVKRSRLAPLLADQQPSHQHIGKACRFDVYDQV